MSTPDKKPETPKQEEIKKESPKQNPELIQHKTIYHALAAFQQEMKPLHEGSAGHGYSYADLSEMIMKINPLMKKHGLGFRQPINEDKLHTIIFFPATGETLASSTSLRFDELKYQTVTKTNQDGTSYEKDIIPGFEGMNTAQAMGSMITYMRRYCLGAELGIVTEKDTDGTGEKSTGYTKKNEEDNRPWLTEKSFEKLLSRIKAGEPNIYAQTDKAFKMKKNYRAALKAAKPETQKSE